MYLFDASAVVNLVKRGVLDHFIRGATIELAFYESLNSVWKERKILKKIDKNTSFKLIEILGDIFKVMQILPVNELGKETFELAVKENITMYDAFYVCSAIKNKLTLVTDDSSLRRVASKYVNAISSSDLTR